MKADDETDMTDIELLPDGRIFVFGASRQVLELLRGLEGPSQSPTESRLRVLLESTDASHDLSGPTD